MALELFALTFVPAPELTEPGLLYRATIAPHFAMLVLFGHPLGKEWAGVECAGIFQIAVLWVALAKLWDATEHFGFIFRTVAFVVTYLICNLLVYVFVMLCMSQWGW